jgi:signal transduction histidine kinase
MGVYLLVIAAGLVVVVVVANTASARQFDLFVSRRGQQWAEQLAPELEAHYAFTGSWDGAEALLGSPVDVQFGRGSRFGPPDVRMGSGEHMQGMMDGSGRMMGPNMWGAMGIRLVLVDTEGRVAADSADELVGEPLSDEIISRGASLYVGGERVGTLVGTDLGSTSVMPSVTRDFLQAINRSVFLASLVAMGVALVLGTVLFQRITRPLGDMSAAARRVAAGDLETQVPVAGRDELGQLARSFNQMAGGLRQQQALRRKMVADIAHELRTPISIMQGTLEAMLDGILPPDGEELRGLHDETLQLGRLVADLRTLSLADAGQLTLEREPVDVGELVRDVVGRMEVLADEQDITLEHAVADTPSIEGDSQRLAQVLTNLIDNALRFTPEGGEVRVGVEGAGEHVRVSVADNGPGIAAEALPHVFDRFWRGDKSRSRAGGGSGLGLAIARQLVEAHGGSVEVESEVGEGTTFIVQLPTSEM